MCITLQHILNIIYYFIISRKVPFSSQVLQYLYYLYLYHLSVVHLQLFFSLQLLWFSPLQIPPTAKALPSPLSEFSFVLKFFVTVEPKEYFICHHGQKLLTTVKLFFFNCEWNLEIIKSSLAQTMFDKLIRISGFHPF